MQKIYNQEYEEVVARIENTLDLTDESPTYPLVPTSLYNPEISYSTRGCSGNNMVSRNFHLAICLSPGNMNLMALRALIDLLWSQQAPQMQPDDIDRDPRYSQYPYQEADEYEEDEEDMEVDERAPGKTGSAHMAAPTSTRRSYHHPEATYAFPRQDQTPGLTP